MMPTIVHAASYSAEYPGNFIASLSQLRGLCLDVGWQTVFLFPENASRRAWFESLKQDGWNIRCFPGPASRARATVLLARIVAEEDVRLIHTHFVEYDLSALAARRLGTGHKRSRPDIPLLWHAHSEIDARGQVAGLRRVTTRIKYGLLAKKVWMIPVGRSVARGFIAAGVPEQRVRLVENGIDLRRATVATRNRTEVLAHLGLDDSRRLALMFGWEPIRKGVDTALEAVAAMHAQHPSLALVIVGTDELNGYISGQFGNHLPTWLRIMAPVEDVASLFQAADLFLSPSRSEGLPYSVCEAMANRIPVVLGDIPSVSWAHRSSGALFFPVGNASALANLLVQILDWDEETKAERGRANERLAHDEFDVASWAERMMTVYREVHAAVSAGC